MDPHEFFGEWEACIECGLAKEAHRSTVTVKLPIHNRTPGARSNRIFMRHVSLPEVPKRGDPVDLTAYGWPRRPAPASHNPCVTAIDHDCLGRWTITVEPALVLDPAVLEDIGKLVTEHGWGQPGGPWRYSPASTESGRSGREPQ